MGDLSDDRANGAQAAVNGTTNGTNGTPPYFTVGRDSPFVDQHPTPLKIIIVGAGIGGLSAALSLRRNGHQVDLYEQSRFANEVGAAVHLAPNSNGILRRWGIHAEEFGANPMDRLIEMSEGGKIHKNVDLTEPNKMWQHPWFLAHRVNLHEKLKAIATGDGVGPPAKLHTSSKVDSLDAAKGTVTLADGTTVSGDVVLGADGIYSKTRSSIKDAKLVRSGKAAFRFLLPRKVGLDDPLTKPITEELNALSMWYGGDRRLVMYPCNNNELLNFVCIHPDSESHASSTDEWNKQGDLDQILKVYQGFDPRLLALIKKVDQSSIKVWQLLDMEKLPTFTTGKLALIGDAAHPFTPHQGQGAGQAIEDAATLSIVLPRGTSPEAVPERLKLYEKIRYERAHAIQEYSRQAGKDWIDGKPQIDMMSYTQHNFGHDELDHSANVFKRWQWAQKKNMYWRMPIGFGPFPGPRQDVFGRSLADGPRRTFKTVSVKFKTSRTYLETLFPTTSYRFKSHASVCTASFSLTQLGNMLWLGNKGYTHLGLYIHGVDYVKKDGTTISGTHMPLLFESLTDPITSGREELGMPKLFCDIDVDHQPSSVRVQASWRGARFFDCELSDLKEDSVASEHGTIGGEADYGILVHRYIPAVGAPGRADAEYSVVVPHEEETVAPTVSYVARARPENAKVRIQAGDWEGLPTLHHVTSALAAIPIYEVLSAKLVEGTGVPDVSAARRIE